MGTVVKTQKDKPSEKQLKMRQEMTDYIKNVLMDQLITSA